jgi:hypothetical protein
MAFFDLRDEVYDAIREYVTPLWPHTAISWPNEDFERPTGAAFLAVEVFGDLYGQQSIGADEQADNRWDEDGQLMFHVFTPRGRGFSSSRGAAKALANLFRGTRLLNDRLEFMDAQVGPGQLADEQGNFHVTTVAIDWRLMEA